ncbi:MAG: DNA/RNA nuclease SfsA, partial [Clostridiales bacterium]
MEYPRISEAIFLKRPNRFIAEIDIAGQTEICHVKNTGRCRELLLPGAKILIQEAHNPQRKTKYDLISVWKGQKLINMDAQAPNQVFGQWLPQSGLFQQLTLVRPEKSFGNSRFDFYIEADGDKIFAEIKGVTLEENGVARFPDAPTERGVKHLRELIRCHQMGFDAYVVFIIQMANLRYFEPNWLVHPQFGQALTEAHKQGVHLLALDCLVTENTI